MIKIELPFWMSGPRFAKTADIVFAWWSLCESWLRWPASQIDVTTCSLPILRLIAWQRDIESFKQEPLSMFRARVKFAYVNAEDSGSKAGFFRIFERLGIVLLSIEERVAGIDWDVVLLHISDGQLSLYGDLLIKLIDTYGRTCRRYQFVGISSADIGITAFDTGNIWALDSTDPIATTVVRWDDVAWWDTPLITWN